MAPSNKLQHGSRLRKIVDKTLCIGAGLLVTVVLVAPLASITTAHVGFIVRGEFFPTLWAHEKYDSTPRRFAPRSPRSDLVHEDYDSSHDLPRLLRAIPVGSLKEKRET